VIANPGDLGSLIGANFESATLEVVPGAIVIGDANLSGSIWTNPPTNTVFDQADVVATLQYTVSLVEFTSAQMLRANVDNSSDIGEPRGSGSRVNVGDVILMQQRSLGLIPCYPHPLDAVNCPAPPEMVDVRSEHFTVELGKAGFDWSNITSDVASGLVEMPITVKGSDVQGYQLSIAYGESGMSGAGSALQRRFAWTSVSNDADGVLRLTGITSAGVSQETVATVVFELNGNQQATGERNRHGQQHRRRNAVHLTWSHCQPTTRSARTSRTRSTRARKLSLACLWHRTLYSRSIRSQARRWRHLVNRKHERRRAHRQLQRLRTCPAACTSTGYRRVAIHLHQKRWCLVK
jgi:hypothetical protein